MVDAKWFLFIGWLNFLVSREYMIGGTTSEHIRGNSSAEICPDQLIDAAK